MLILDSQTDNVKGNSKGDVFYPRNSSSITDKSNTNDDDSSSKAESKSQTKTEQNDNSAKNPAAKKKPKVKKSKAKNSNDKEAHFPIEINAIEKWQLLQIDGVGEKTADKILAYRNKVGIIYNLELLKNINGIGEQTLAYLSKYIYVSSGSYKPMPKNKKENIKSNVIAKKTVAANGEISGYKKVNINTANSEKIAECLMLSMKQANKVVEIRAKINGFKVPREIALADIPFEKINKIINYIEV